MITEKNERKCLSCNKSLKGRTDKKFCDDYCRSDFNNIRRNNSPALVKSINKILFKNRQILEILLLDGEATAKASRERLLEKGFQFKYHTHLYQAKNGNNYFYCYEYGYLPLDNNWFLIVKREAH